MKVMVTGGAGFIGSNLVRLLLNHTKYDVAVVDALTYAGNLENIQDCMESGRVSFYRVDICDKDALEAVFSTDDYAGVFHLAAESHVDRSIHSAAPFVRTNIVGTLNVVECTARFCSGRLVHVSTDEVYGSLAVDAPPFTELSHLNPTSPYAASKASSDLLVLSFVSTHGLNAIVTRCSNNYGPYQFPEKLIPLFTLNALEGKELPVYGDGLQVRDWIHVEDHCMGLIELFHNGHSGEVYNLGGNTELQNMQVINQIVTLTGASSSLVKRVEDRKGHDRRYAMDNSKVTSQIGWYPTTSFEEGLRATVEWYKQNTSWANRVRTGEYREFYDKHYQELRKN